MQFAVQRYDKKCTYASKSEKIFQKMIDLSISYGIYYLIQAKLENEVMDSG